MKKFKTTLLAAAATACVAAAVGEPVIVDRMHFVPLGSSAEELTTDRMLRQAEAMKASQGPNVMSVSQNSSKTSRRISSLDRTLTPDQVVDDGTRINFNIVNWYMGQFLGIGAIRPCGSTPVERVCAPDGTPGAPMGTAGVYANGKYYTSTYQTGGGQVFKASFFAYDATTWELLDEIQLNPQWYSVYDNGAYNPVDGRIYVLGYDGVHRPYLSELNPETGVYTQLVQCVVNIKAMAFDADGVLYALTGNGEIEKVDINTGIGTPVCRVDDQTDGINYWQTIAFDYHTGELFWVHTDNSFVTDLRRINLEDGTVDIVSDLFNLFGATGAWVTSPSAPDKAPGTVSAINATFSREGLGGDIVVTAPANTFDGSGLSGDVTLTISVDGAEVAVETVAAGGTVTVRNYDFKTTGQHGISVVASNGEGAGPSGKVTVYCGIDTPVQVLEPTLAVTDGVARLTWKAPQEGVHGGYVDPATLTYDVVRLPGEVPVATGLAVTEFSETLPADLDRYSYAITAQCGEYRGEAIESNSVVVGQGYPVPLSVNLGDEEFFRLSNIFDLDGDGATFYSTWGAVSCNIAFTYVPHTSDDWFITAPVYLEPGNYLYQIQYMATSDGVDATFTMGRDNVPGAQTQELASVKNLRYVDGIRTTWLYFRAETAGNYYFGIHYTPTVPGMQTSLPYGNFKTLKILAGPDDMAPAAVSDLTGRAYTKGELKTELTFTVPSTTYSGQPLAAVDRVEICDGEDNLIGSVSDVSPGTQATFTDTACKSGVNTYHVYAVNENGRGAMAVLSVFAGDDAPGMISTLDYTIEDNRILSFRWGAPTTTGINGGYVDPDGLTYDFCRSQYSYQEPFAVNGGSNLKEREFQYTECGADSYFGLTQHTYYYGILPKNAVGNGIMGVVGIVCGAPYTPPYAESFPGGSNQTVVWATQLIDGEPAITISTGDAETGIMPSDDDNGMILFRHDNDVKTGQAMISPILKLENLKNPVVAFDVWHNSNADSDAYISVQGSKSGSSFAPIGDVIAINDGSGRSGWVRHYIPLKDYNNSDRVFIALLGVNSTARSYFAIDNFAVYDDLEVDLALTELVPPETSWINEESEFTAVVTCRGAVDVDGYEVELIANGAVVATGRGKALVSGQTDRVRLVTVPDAGAVGTATEYEARIVLADDANPENDKASATVEVRGSSLPVPADVRATIPADSKTDLSWKTPEIADPQEITEGWEDAEAFAITDQGEWHMVDADRLMPCGIGGLTYPNMDKGRAYMVWNPGKVGFKDAAWQPRTGEQALIAFASDAYTVDGIFDGTQLSDEWLISPHMAGDTEVKFMAKPAASGAVERFEFLVSYGTRDIADFTRLGEEVVMTDAQWTEFTYILPADACYFAIRYVSHGQEAFAMLLDDITCTPGWRGLEVRGYNIYVDGVRINDTPVNALTYALTIPSEDCRVAVSAVYAEGESNAVPVDLHAAVDTLAHDGVKVTGDAGSITVTGAYDCDITLFNTAGIAVGRTRATGHDVFANLAEGIYLVRAGSRTFKTYVGK